MAGSGTGGKDHFGARVIGQDQRFALHLGQRHGGESNEKGVFGIKIRAGALGRGDRTEVKPWIGGGLTSRPQIAGARALCDALFGKGDCGIRGKGRAVDPDQVIGRRRVGVARDGFIRTGGDQEGQDKRDAHDTGMECASRPVNLHEKARFPVILDTMLKKSRLTLRALGVVGLGLAILVSLNVPGAFQFPTYRLIGGESTVTMVGYTGMTMVQRGEIEAWRKKSRHFGAFAIGTAGAWGSTWGYNDVDAAEQRALGNCGGTSKSCRVVARMVPTREPVDGELAVSRSTATRFLEYSDYGGAKAFAIAPTGASGWSWSALTRTRAKARALARCEEQLAEGSVQPQDRPVCRVVHASWR